MIKYIIMKKTQKIFNTLSQMFPNAKCELEFNNNFELLISVILSAQCADKRVNEVTKTLFKNFPTPNLLANASISEVENIIKPCGLYKNKAKNIISASKNLAEKFDGKVPSSFKSLLTLSGVGRKTASVVLSVGFNKPAFAVDTHVFRVAKRLGLSNGLTPEKVEEDLKQKFPKSKWSKTHHLFVFFGRYFCKAKNPQCENCQLKNICVYYNSQKLIKIGCKAKQIRL